MSLYARIFAALYDRLTAQTERELAPRRAALLARARGRVLDVGAGTGNNLRHLPPAVTELLLAEPDPAMARRLGRRLGEAPVPARVLPAPAEDLPLDDASVDAVVVTLVLCTVPEPARALAEIQRVLAPGGRLLVLEHVRAEDPRLARRQDFVRPLQQLVARGCHPDRDTLGLLERAPLRLERVERFALPGAPAHLRPAIEVVATKA